MIRVLRLSDLRCPTTGKNAYPDKATAERAIARAWAPGSMRDSRWGRMPVRAYQCPSCGWWHLSSQHSANDRGL